MTTASPRTIHAIVDQEALSRLPSFFDASLHDILNELFQNARRAGATHVSVEAHDHMIAVTDDGRGIDDPQAVLSFGRSQWNNSQVEAEHPAGMGFYALARRDTVTIQSNHEDGQPWAVTLRPEHFAGQAGAEVTDTDQAPQRGTRVTFNWEYDYETYVQQCAKYFPLPVTLNGESVERQDFLNDADAVHLWEGLRFGVYLDENNTGMYNYWRGRGEGLNFHGIVLEARDQVPKIPAVDGHRVHTVKIDVVDCPHLELTLPARKELVNNPFLDQMVEAATRAIYETIASANPPIDVTYGIQQDAARLGVAIPDARPMLVPWFPHTEWERHNEERVNERHPVPDDAIIFSAELEEMNKEHTIHRALDRNGMLPRVFKEMDNKFKGYQWYDALPHINTFRCVAKFGDREYNVTRENRNLPGDRPDSITVELGIGPADSSMDTYTSLETDIAFHQDEYSWLEEVNPLITANADVTVDDLAEFMMAAYFSPSLDGDSDSYSTQESWAKEATRANAVSILRSKEEAFRETVADALSKAGVTTEMPTGSTIKVHMLQNRLLDIQVIQPTAPAK